MEKLIEILRELHDDVDFESEEALVDDGIIDSLDIDTWSRTPQNNEEE